MFGKNKPPTLADVPASLDEARSRLLLRVYGAEHAAVDQLEAELKGVVEGLPAVQRITPDLSVGAVVDLPEGYLKVSPSTIQAWGCTLEDVIRAGMDRAQGHEFGASRLDDKTILVRDEVYAGAVWVLPELASSLPITGAPIAWALGRGLTLVTGSDDPNGMMVAAATIQELLQDGERVESVTPHRLTQLGWEPIGWAPTPEHTDELVTRLHKAQVYGRQAEPLRARLGSHGQAAGVSEYTVVRKPDGQPWSITNWTQQSPAALPVVDEIILVRLDGATVGIRWADLVDQAQALLEPVAELPARYLTQGFPSDDMVMAALGRR
ncbi:hypothetical protein [Microlunatus sp. Gsoil 973]|uniref:hypothetical protein n=1 Tax=Microlunatus sp. Gsoil 973 TaxID=2672569 RepID=UPI0012B49666|nr:hypothetical protein [Microlunatus sp. Gsoil 973]QGN34624.1 hypothetical protein GJV80_19340 [Microlunatus sp. Gsoil 973]